ncbi:MAG: glycoside hydrolase family 32 protein [bacterium]|nr:glycoside hydrolase family 32 protein [bacterium]
MKLFYTPDHARVGDVIPFYDEGQFKLFYLKNWNPYFGEDATYGWHMLTTQDHIHFEEKPTGIMGGTGCVLRVDGIYHLFYCTFQREPQRQFVHHAISEDGMKTWKDLPEETLLPDESIYVPTDWRDPHIIWNEEEQCWWMVLCAQAVGETKRRGCVGLCKSTDLHHWTCCQPLYAPDSCMSAYECPDLFYMNGWWYLVYSQFTDRFATIYRMSKSLNGPWIRPRVDSFDGRAYYAAKTLSDGENRYIYGWCPSRTQNSYKFNPGSYPGYDYNTYDWGGSMVVHKIHQHEDGSLGVSPLPILKEQLPTRNRWKWQPLNGEWKVEDNNLSVSSPYGYADIITRNEVPETALLETTVTFQPGTDRVGIALQVDEDFTKGYYFYLEPNRQRLHYRGPLTVHEQGGWTFPYDVELERPVNLKAGEPCHVQIYIDSTVVVIYVNGDVALSTRAYDLHSRKFGLIVSDGEAEFRDTQLYTL